MRSANCMTRTGKQPEHRANKAAKSRSRLKRRNVLSCIKKVYFDNVVWTSDDPLSRFYVTRPFRCGLRTLPDVWRSRSSLWPDLWGLLDDTVFTSHAAFVAVSMETACNHFETKRTALESTANLMLLPRLMGNEFSGQLLWSAPCFFFLLFFF